MSSRDRWREHPVEYRTSRRSRRGQSLTVVLGFGILLVAFGLPLLRDGIWGPCTALEGRIVALNAAGVSFARNGQDIRTLAGLLAWTRPDVELTGGVAHRHVSAQDPLLPAWFGCYLRYWRVTIGV